MFKPFFIWDFFILEENFIDKKFFFLLLIIKTSYSDCKEKGFSYLCFQVFISFSRRWQEDSSNQDPLSKRSLRLLLFLREESSEAKELIPSKKTDFSSWLPRVMLDGLS